MAEVVRRKRDPEARRRAIVQAAAELITEVGVDAITHRMVAVRAEVPLGATTQYFATLDDLRSAALQLLIDHVDERMTVMRETLAGGGGGADALTSLLLAAFADGPSIRADRAVVTAAVHDPRLRELARVWSDEIVGYLAPTYGRQRARAVAVFIDGALWHCQMSDEPLEHALIHTALTGILGDPTSPERSARD